MALEVAAKPRLDALLLGLEQALLGWRDARRGRGGFDLLEQGLELAVELETARDALAQREARGRLLGWAHRLEQGDRFTQSLLAKRRTLERAVGLTEALAFGGREAQRGDRPVHAHLLGLAEPGQGVGEGEREPARVALARHLGGEIASEGEALAGPGLSPPQQACALVEREPVIPGEGIDHARLVHGRERLLWSIAAKQQSRTLKRSFDP